MAVLAHRPGVAGDLKKTTFYSAPAVPDVGGQTKGAKPSEVRNALDRIIRSRTMAPSKRLIEFLAFVVETTLQGHAYQLKETTIGVAVFGRVPDYDPKVDAVVRNQAWRLRSKLREYYATEGSADPLVITVPKGQYTPVFVERNGGSEHPVAAIPVRRSLVSK
jgi:hypothetical protein